MEELSFLDKHIANKSQISDEITREILDYSYQKDAYKGHRTEGNYLIAYFVEHARSLQYLKEGILVEEKSSKENAYIGIAVHRNSDFRFIENLIVTVTVIDDQGKTIGKKQHLYHPHPGLHHYGMNWKLPGDGIYTLQVHLEGLDSNWRMNNENKYISGNIEVDFPHVMIATGRQIS